MERWQPPPPPVQQDEIRRRLIAGWLDEAATAEEKAAGLNQIMAACWHVLAPIIGSVAVRAVVVRALSLASRAHPDLAKLVIVDGGIDARGWLAVSTGKEVKVARDELVVLLDHLFGVFHGLLGDTLTPLMIDIEAELRRDEDSSRLGKEE